MDIDGRINNFKESLANDRITRIIRQYIILGVPYVFEAKETANRDLQLEVADHFEIHPTTVTIVGSAKLGFSIAPRKRYRHFGDKSDIDVAIVCDTLFDKMWQRTLEYGLSNAYWADERVFKDYLLKGWIRPDKLPKFDLQAKWWEFFRQLTRKGDYGPYKISAGLYRTWDFFEKYQSICVEKCSLEITHADNSLE